MRLHARIIVEEFLAERIKSCRIPGMGLRKSWAPALASGAGWVGAGAAGCGVDDRWAAAVVCVAVRSGVMAQSCSHAQRRASKSPQTCWNSGGISSLSPERERSSLAVVAPV